ncbi:MAG: hypothetical protein EZS28_045400, partial [Streblomastix strix]
MDSSSINYKAEITQTISARTYGPLANESTTVRNLLIETEGQFDVKGKILFNYINFVVQATSLSNGQHTIQGLLSTSQISLQNCQYHMASSEISIGKSLVCMLKGGTQTITNLTVSDITSVENIIKAEFDESGTLDISNCKFNNITQASSTIIGGTTKVILSHSSNQLIISNSQFKLCKALYTQGGAIFVELKSVSAQVTLTQTKFEQCESQSGGGVYSIFSTGGQIQINNLCEFTQCKATSGNGGGIYAQFNFASACIFKINSGTISECEAISSASATPPTGYGGGIMLVGTGEYVASSKTLDLKGMNISGNTAEYEGQSLYVIMSKLKEWCRYGSLGEFVKGNYSDTTSAETDLQGIPIDFNSFESLTQLYISDNQKLLEDYWRHATEDTDLYVKSDGDDDQFCTSINPCKRLDAAYVMNNINIPYIYQVNIMDSSSINYKAEITQTFSERIYGPLD